MSHAPVLNHRTALALSILALANFNRLRCVSKRLCAHACELCDLASNVERLNVQFNAHIDLKTGSKMIDNYVSERIN